MTAYIPKIRHKGYVTKTARSHCGIYALDNIIRAYSGKNISDPKTMHKTFFGKNFGWVFPWDMENILKEHGLDANWDSARKVGNKIEFLEDAVMEGPVIIRIDLIDDGVNPLWGRLSGHWIVLWGYDSTKERFYAYDSRKKEKDLPVGNCTFAYKELENIWRGSLMPFAFKYLYVKVRYPNA